MGNYFSDIKKNLTAILNYILQRNISKTVFKNHGIYLFYDYTICQLYLVMFSGVGKQTKSCYINDFSVTACL